MKAPQIVIAAALVFLLHAGTSRAQQAAANGAVVSMGHIHLTVKDVEAGKKFYVDLGGTPIKIGMNEGVKFPGVLILLRKGDPTGGTEGSSVNHIGFAIKDGVALMAKMKAQGVKITSNGSDGHGGYLFSPEGVKIEIAERPALPVPIQFDHVHFYVADPAADGGNAWAEMQAWYRKTFGAHADTTTLVPTKTGLPAYSQSSIAGANLRFSKPEAASAPTKGRALDHIGFEVPNLEAFCKKLEANGTKLDMPYRVTETGVALAFITDPWGTYIELNEGLNKLAQ